MSWSTSSIAGPAVDDPAQLAAELLALGRVEARAGLVEAHDARRGGQRARHADELALALRELVGQPVDDVLEADERERVVRTAGAVGGAFHRTSRIVAHTRRPLGGDGEVLAHGEVVEELARPATCAPGRCARARAASAARARGRASCDAPAASARSR